MYFSRMVNDMSPFEGIMLICFGISWPISIIKSVRVKRVEGKSPLFMGIVCFGYISGIAHKVIYSFDWIIVLYAVNMIMILVDISLYFYYNRINRSVQT